MENDFSIVFDKMQEAYGEIGTDSVNRATEAEFDEIDELRRFVLEINEPEPMSYTIT